MTDPFIDTLREKGAVDFTNDDGKTLHDKIETRILNAIEPEFCDKWPAINNILIDLLAKLNINKLYEYQYRAISNILNDEDVVLMAPTAGGKTLCYNLPIINDLMANASHRALYIYPMKALIADQRKQLLELTHPLREEGYNIESWVYDGDTPTEERRCIRNNPPQILLTNPEMVNYSLLQWADKWNISSFRNLKYIVIDEIHTYRGYFGSNMAHLLRRLLHFLALNDAKPVLVLSTATCANPEEHATQLTERDFSGKVVSAKRNMRAKKTLYFIQPNIPPYKYYDIYKSRIIKAAVACAEMEKTVLVFCQSRKFVENITNDTRKYLKDTKNNITIANEFNVDAYRAGIGNNQREIIENRLRTNKPNIVYSTNALEIGINIGSLDVVILAGFPDNMFSAWQQIGRAGRRFDKEAHVLFYATDNPYDNYFATDIDAFVRKGLDYILINTNNKMILNRHEDCLLAETALLPPQERRLILDVIGSTVYEDLENINLECLAVNRTQKRINLRGEWSKPYNIIYRNNIIGNISSSHVQKEAYLGAIYMHAAKKYRVVAHGQSDIVIEDLADNELRNTTKPKLWTVVSNNDEKKIVYVLSDNKDNIFVNYGELVIFQNYGGYTEMQGDRIVSNHNLEQPEALQKQVMSFWLSCNNIKDKSGLVALAQILHIGAPLIIPGDRYDVSTMTDNDDNIYVYENIQGGIGVAKPIVKLWPKIIEQGLMITEKCTCEDGCPNCLQQSKYVDANKVNKKAGVQLAKRLLNLYNNNRDSIVYTIKDGSYVR